MSTVPKRIAVKFNLVNEPQIQPKDVVPIFQRWIQEHAVDGLLIDVIDYKHVQDGPGIILIADEGDYAYDLGDGRVGLKYTRKRALPDTLTEAVSQSIALATRAAERLEDEAELGNLEFDLTSGQLYVIDRQHYPNTQASFDAIQADIQVVLNGWFGDSVQVDYVNQDQRQVLKIAFHLEASHELNQSSENHLRV